MTANDATLQPEVKMSTSRRTAAKTKVKSGKEISLFEGSRMGPEKPVRTVVMEIETVDYGVKNFMGDRVYIAVSRYFYPTFVLPKSYTVG